MGALNRGILLSLVLFELLFGGNRRISAEGFKDKVDTDKYNPSSTINVRIDNWHPWEGLDDKGKPAGRAVKALEEIFSRMNIKDYEFSFTGWQRGLYDIENGKADILLSGVRRPKREQLFHISEPIGYIEWRAYSVNSREEILSGDKDNLYSKFMYYGLADKYEYPPQIFNDPVFNYLKHDGANVVDENGLVKKIFYRRIVLAVFPEDNIEHIKKGEYAFAFEEKGIDLQPVTDVYKDGVHIFFYPGFPQAKGMPSDTFSTIDETINSMRDDGTLYSIVQQNYDKSMEIIPTD